MYLEVQWTCRGVAHSFCTAVKQLSEQKKRCQDCLMSSTQSLYGLCLRSVAHSLICSFPGNMPLLRMSTHRPGTSLHVISFTRPSPVSVLQTTNTGVRWPGYEARVRPCKTINHIHMTISAYLGNPFWKTLSPRNTKLAWGVAMK